MQARRFLARVLAGGLAIMLTACGGGGSAAGSAIFTGRPPNGSATASPPAAVPTTSASIALPTSDASGIVIDTGLTDPTYDNPAFPYIAVAAVGKLWLGGPKGLVEIDPATNTASIADRERGASLGVSGDVLWRAGYRDGTILRYQLDSMQRLEDLPVPHPLFLLATDSGIWVSEHHEGQLVKLDPNTGDVLATTTVTTPECCGASELVERDGHLFVAITKDGTIVEVDPDSAAIVATHRLPTACDLLSYAAGAWWTCWLGGTEPEEVAAEENGRSFYLQRVDPATFASQKIKVGIHYGLPGELNGEAWVPVGDTLVNLDPSTGAPVRVVRLNIDQFEGKYVTEAFGSVWVYGPFDTRVVRLRPEDLQ